MKVSSRLRPGATLMLEFTYPLLSKRRFPGLVIFVALINVGFFVWIDRSVRGPSWDSTLYAFTDMSCDPLNRLGVSLPEGELAILYSGFALAVVFLSSLAVCWAHRRRITRRFLLTETALVRRGRGRVVQIELAEVGEVRAGRLGAAFRTRRETLTVSYRIFPVDKFLRQARESVVAAGGAFSENELYLALWRAGRANFVCDNAWRLALLAAGLTVSFIVVAACALIALGLEGPDGPAFFYSAAAVVVYLAAIAFFATEGFVAARRGWRFKGSYEALRLFSTLVACMAVVLCITFIVSLMAL